MIHDYSIRVRRAVVICCVALLLCSRPCEARDIKIAFWNVENLFDQYLDRRAPNADVFVTQRVAEKLRKDAEVIRFLDADIVGLMEVENRGLLRELCEQYLADSGYKYYELSEAGDERGIDVAVISRLPFLSYTYNVPGFYRGISASRFSIAGEPFYVLTNHWKSRFGGGEELRMACAKRVVEITQLIEQYEGEPVPIVIGGDFNDNDTDASVTHLETAGLVNTLKTFDAKNRWTLPYDNFRDETVEFDSFDHVFINRQLSDKRGIDWSGSAVVRPPMMVTRRRIRGQWYEWPDDDRDDHIGYSDHYPVITHIRVPE